MLSVIFAVFFFSLFLEKIVQMILTITLNPALDKSISVPKLIPDKKMRCPNPTVEAVGGGINISKAIKELGGESIALFPSGGSNGKLLEQLLTKEGIKIKTIDQVL